MKTLAQVETDIGTFSLITRQVAGVEETVFEILLTCEQSEQDSQALVERSDPSSTGDLADDVLMTSLSPISEQRLSASALEEHQGQSPLRVLVGGLGLGYTAYAALQDPRVGEVCVVEKMGFVIDWMQQGLLPLSPALSRDDRVTIIQGDIYEQLMGPAKGAAGFDLILVDVDHAPDHPLSEESAAFYTLAGQKRVACHLAEGGILGVWSAVEDESFTQVLATAYTRSRGESVFWQDRELPEADFEDWLWFAST